MAESRNAFPPRERLRKRREFLRVYEKGERIRTAFFFLFILKNHLPYSRVGITVSRKLGKTNIRNQLKRQLREIFRRNKRSLIPPCDLVINANHATSSASFERLEKEFVRVLSDWQGTLSQRDETRLDNAN